MDSGPAPGKQTRVQKRYGGAVPRKAHGNHLSKADQEMMQEANESYFLDALVQYSNIHNLRNFSAGGKPAERIELADDHLNGLAEKVRQAVIAYADDRSPDHVRRAIDLWGAARPGIDKVLAHTAKDNPKQTHDAWAAVASIENYVVNAAASAAVNKAARPLEAKARPDAAYHQAEYAMARRALLETHELLEHESSLPKIAEVFKENKLISPLATFLAARENLAQAEAEAEESGVFHKGAKAAEMIKLILSVTKNVLVGVNLAASLLWPAAKEEAKHLFMSFAERISEHGDFVEGAGEMLGKAVAIAEIAKGTFELIDGIASGNAEKAYDGAEGVLMGGTSLLMEGAGTGATLVAPALVYIFAETVKACIDVGALLREVPHMLEVEAVGRFCDSAGTLGHTAAEAFGALSERYASHVYSSDPNMQQNVSQYIELHMRDASKAFAKGIRDKLHFQLSDKTNPHFVGHYDDAIRTMGPRAVGSLEYIVNKGAQADPGTVANNAIALMQGIARMGQWVHAAHGHEREDGENAATTEKINGQVNREWRDANRAEKLRREREGDRPNWIGAPKGPTDEQLGLD